jgi:deoxyribodipyrimidine photolyase-related protein
VRTNTVWVLGDQLNRAGAALAGAEPASTRVLFVVPTDFLASRQWHVQRLHVVLASMRRFALSLVEEGFAVDWRIASSMGDGLAAHIDEFSPKSITVMEPMEHRLRTTVKQWGESRWTQLRMVPSNQFLCSSAKFAEWAETRKGRLKMEDFYRFQRTRLNVLMTSGDPEGGKWNFDESNREPPPKDGRRWPTPQAASLDEVDTEISELIATYAPLADGKPWEGLWPTTRADALLRLRRVLEEVLPVFGPHEDAMLADNWHLAHTVLSSSINLGMLSPGEVVAAAEAAYRSGAVPLASAEGFIRQIIGWREYVYGLSHLWGPEYFEENQLDAQREVPSAFRGGPTKMRCVSLTAAGIEDRAYAHHIQRLMILGNLALLSGVNPAAMQAWMRERFIDGADWVMAPNVIGMALHADGGRMATKPYASGGAYISKMSNYCKGCAYDPKQRTGPKACPFTTLYWDFMDRHHDRFKSNHRMSQPIAGLKRLSDLPQVRLRAAEVLQMLDAGEL